MKSPNRRQLEAFRESRDAWLAILVANPDSLEAPALILQINSKIDYIRTLMHLDGDYED